jgi:hypothetical protein
MTRQRILEGLVTQVEAHRFQHLSRNRQTGHAGGGWAGGLNIYSANTDQPEPQSHFDWLNGMLQQIAAAHTPSDRVRCANEILKWGGMATKVSDDQAGQGLLDAVIRSARQGRQSGNAPMNSSYTKIAAVFGYRQGNTIWDSRVSTAVCFRLACIVSDAGLSVDDARALFPHLGFVGGMSQRVLARLPLVQRYWPNVYQSWIGHFAGAALLNEIAQLLNQQNVACPQFGNAAGAGGWNPWKVNMVFFADDIISCASQAARAPSARSSEPKLGPARRSKSSPAKGATQRDDAKVVGGPPTRNISARTADDRDDEDGLCGHHVINEIAGIHFEPDCIANNGLNSAPALQLPDGEHGLGQHRLLLEFFRMANGNCKISARMRIADPAFAKVHEAAIDAGCPQKQGGVDLTKQTCSVFVYRRGRIRHGQELNDIRKFTCEPPDTYRRFLEALPAAMQPPY